MTAGHSLRELKGIGEKTEKLFQKLNIHTIEDLLQYYPRGYDIYEEPEKISALSVGRTGAVLGAVSGSVGLKKVRNLTVVTTTITSEGEQLSLTWFNMPFLRNTLRRGSVFVFRGKIARQGSSLVMEQPAIHTPAQYQALLHSMQPLYGLTAGLRNGAVAKAVAQALEYKSLYREYLPEEFRTHYRLADYNYAVETIHFPTDKKEFITARRRLVFDEFFFFILAVRRLREKTESHQNSYPMKKVWETEEVLENLPYRLTNAQMRVWQEIEDDLQGHDLMSRLIQGDVGSGKTILAFLSMVMTARNGYQAALMVPTEVLARQHYEDLLRLLEANELSFCHPVLLTGSVKGKQRREIYSQIESGEANLIIGTHALIQESVIYDKLALVITDEQHRFGVKQRESLCSRGAVPNVMVMSATPIPRTLAIILYGDLDISVIDELPARRLPIKNCVVNTGYRNTAYKFILKEVEAGHQIYIICPMIEESEGMDGENVLDYAEKLRQIYPGDVKISCLHGKMKPAEKNEIMEAYAAGDIQILISTTVVEVGVNVPNATVMMVENAERFGLAQLHQLRGRVGRGDAQSYCIFVQGTEGDDTKERLEILNKSNDGFYIAGEDLKLRGPGDLFGIRQSGLMEFRLGDIFQDAEILKSASEAAAGILALDEELVLEQHENLRLRLEKYMKYGLENLSL